VKARTIAVQHVDFELIGRDARYYCAVESEAKETKMSRKILSLAGHYLLRKEGVSPLASETPKAALVCPRAAVPDDGTVPVEDVRAVATETALATAVDASPAVLVSLWAHDQRLHPGRHHRRGR
jgi:hypothetical protein